MNAQTAIERRIQTGIDLLRMVQEFVPLCKCPQHDRIMSTMEASEFWLEDALRLLREETH